MISAVLDANTLVSGVVGFARAASTPGELLRGWRAGRFVLIVSDHILAELEHALSKPYFRRRLTPEQVRRVLDLLRQEARATSLSTVVRGVAADPEDDFVLATAVSGRAAYLVTGDKKLLALGSYQDIPILSPRAFLDDVLSAQ